MAIIFTEHSIYGKILNAFNNNIVRFKTDNSQKIEKGEVIITAGSDSYSFEIMASPEDEFYFNLKTIIQKLINKNNFKDDCTYAQIGDVWQDDNAYLQVSVKYRVYFTDLSYDSSIKEYEFIKGANQLTEKQFYDTRGDVFPVHFPGDIVYLTFFKGYPFDITLFGENIQIAIDSFLAEPAFIAADLATMISTTHNEISFSNAKGIQRLIISDGESKWDKIFDKYHSITYGNYLIKLRVIDTTCGVYLKWHNQYGGWDYWLFDKHYAQSLKNKTTGIINNDFNNLPDTISPEINSGQEVTKRMTLYANGVYREEAERVMAILKSPKVMMWIGAFNEQATADRWMEIFVSGNPKFKSMANRVSFSIDVDIPKLYTLSL